MGTGDRCGRLAPDAAVEPICTQCLGLKAKADLAQCAYEPLAGTADSEVVEVEVSAHRRVIRRQRYRPSCRCPAQPGIVTAAGPAKLIAKGSLGVSVWSLILIDKFLFQRPTYRRLSDLRCTCCYGSSIRAYG